MSVCVDERIDTVLMISWFSRRSIGAQSPGPSAWRRPTRSSQRPDFFLDLIHRHNILQRISDGAAPRRLSTLMPINLSNSARDKGIGSFCSGRAIPSRDTRNDSVCTANEKKKKKAREKKKDDRRNGWNDVQTRRRRSPTLCFAFWSNNDEHRGTRHAGHLSFAPPRSLISSGGTKFKRQTSRIRYTFQTEKHVFVGLTTRVAY